MQVDGTKFMKIIILTIEIVCDIFPLIDSDNVNNLFNCTYFGTEVEKGGI